MGFSWSTFAHLAQVLAPTIIMAVNPKLAPIAGAIANGISDAEQLPNAKGPDKLQYVVDIANQAAAGINATAGKTIVDPATLNTAATEAINTTVTILKIAHPVAAANTAK